MVGTSAPDKNLGIVFFQLGLGLPDGPDDPLERIGDVGEVGDAAADDEDLALRMGMFAHEINDSFGIFVSLRFVGSAGIFAIICEFFDAAELNDGVGVDDGGAAAGNQSPNPASFVQNC